MFLGCRHWKPLDFGSEEIQILQMDFQISSHFESGQEDQEDTAYMFPGLAGHISESIGRLQQSYHHATHRRLLINYCFRCHEPALVQAYNAFRTKHHPDVTEPSISRFYDNHAFIELRDVSAYLCGDKPSYASHIMSAVPSNLKLILDDLFQTFGCVPHLERFLLFYPTYLEKKRLVEKSLFEEERINKQVAYFLAFSAATELGCSYMMARYHKLFKEAEGDSKWIDSGEFPQKYSLMLHLNHLMARAVWEIDQNTISAILRNGGPEWSQAELATCVQILAFSHHLSTIALALGLNPEDSTEHFNNQEKVKQLVVSYQGRGLYDPSGLQQLSVVISKLKHKAKDNRTSPCKLTRLNSQREEDVKPYMKQIGLELSTQQFYLKMHKLMPNVTAPFRVIEKRREHINPLVEFSDYNFTFMAYPLLNSFTGQSGDRIRDLVEHGQNMTSNKYMSIYCSFGSKAVANTREFRKAMSYYAQNLCGYRHMEYDYKNKFNAFLTIPLRFYLRLLTTSPCLITGQVIREVNHESGRTQLFDLGHVAVLAANVKMSLELTLVMRAFESD